MMTSFSISPPIQHKLAAQKASLLHWASGFPYCMYLDSCESKWDQYGEYELLIGVARNPVILSNYDDFSKVKGKWIMGGLPYELKNRFEPMLEPDPRPQIDFPETAFFIPETIVYIKKGATTFEVEGHKQNLDFFPGKKAPGFQPQQVQKPDFVSNFSKEKYLKTVDILRNHIKEGDFYEINLSQVYSASWKLEDPAALFQKLTQISPVPFAAYFRFREKYLLCASPERFLQRKGSQLLTQPIKGTAPTSEDPDEDFANVHYLQNSLKERAENVMIVDLSRNDLYRSCEPHSVEVPHLFEIQSFPQVHQMVSTVTGTKRDGISNPEILANTFPAGSMTGAPKFRVMNAINQYEGIGRGLYAGSVGYFSPNGDFDLNVVIRSLIYDDAARQLCYQVGGAITYDSDPHEEYEETLLKAKAIRGLFG